MIYLEGEKVKYGMSVVLIVRHCPVVVAAHADRDDISNNYEENGWNIMENVVFSKSEQEELNREMD